MSTMHQAEPSLRETLSTLANTLPRDQSIHELQEVLTSIGAVRDLGSVRAAEIPAEFARAVTVRVDEILKSGNQSSTEMRSLLVLVEQYVASLPSLTEKLRKADLRRLCNANPDVTILYYDYLARTPDGELVGRVELSDGRCLPFKGITLIKTISGEEVSYCDKITIARNGEPTGMAALGPDGRWVIFNGDALGDRV